MKLANSPAFNAALGHLVQVFLQTAALMNVHQFERGLTEVWPNLSLWERQVVAPEHDPYSPFYSPNRNCPRRPGYFGSAIPIPRAGSWYQIGGAEPGMYTQHIGSVNISDPLRRASGAPPDEYRDFMESLLRMQTRMISNGVHLLRVGPRCELYDKINERLRLFPRSAVAQMPVPELDTCPHEEEFGIEDLHLPEIIEQTVRDINLRIRRPLPRRARQEDSPAPMLPGDIVSTIPLKRSADTQTQTDGPEKRRKSTLLSHGALSHELALMLARRVLNREEERANELIGVIRDDGGEQRANELMNAVRNGGSEQRVVDAIDAGSWNIESNDKDRTGPKLRRSVRTTKSFYRYK